MKVPKTLEIDIETAPSIGYYFDLFKEGNIVGQVRDWHILSVAYKWVGQKTVHVMALPDFKGYRKDKANDKALVGELWKLLDEADIVVAHNGKRFDLRKIRARLFKHNFPPPSPFKIVDTLLTSRNLFALDSHRLNAIAKYKEFGSKLPHQGFKLWEDCMAGDKRAWDIMRRYNKQDVVLLDKVYEAIRPWMTNHPNVNLYTQGEGCPTCSNNEIQKRGLEPRAGGYYRQRYQCKNGCWSYGERIKLTKKR